MTTKVSNIEKAKLYKLISYYKSKGYSIESSTKGHVSPPCIGKYVPDLVIRKGKKTTIVEVVSAASFRSHRNKLIHLSNNAAKLKDVVFKLVVTNPKKYKTPFDKRPHPVTKK